MNILPPCRAARFAKVDPGSLCFMRHDEGQCANFVVFDPINGEKLNLPLGPVFPTDIKWPTFVDLGAMTLVSFDKEFDVRLSNDENGWSFDPPPPEVVCLLLADDKLYLRANFSTKLDDFKECFVDLESGNVFCAKQSAEFIRPPGITAFAVDWAFVTREEHPRTIFSSKKP